MTVSAKADSTTLVMGDRTGILVEVVKNGHDGTLVDMPEKEKDYHGLEMVDCIVDSTDLGNNRIQLKYHFTFQAFDPNEMVTLPPFKYAANGDTAASTILTFKVLPVELSPELGDPAQPDSLKIHPDETIVSIQRKWYDYIPDWTIWTLVGLVALAAIVLIVINMRKKETGIFAPRRQLTPYELAIKRLNELKKQQLIEKGLAKQFYTDVTDIWRTYLDGRFGINAMEMTSKQILKKLRENKETHLSSDQMEQLLQLSDFVKFAAMHPSNDEMVSTFNTIYSFIEATKPMPEPKDKNDKQPEKVK